MALAMLSYGPMLAIHAACISGKSFWVIAGVELFMLVPMLALLVAVGALAALLFKRARARALRVLFVAGGLVVLFVPTVWAGTVTWGENRDAPLVEIWTEELEAHGAGPDPMPVAVQHHAMLDAPGKVSALLEAGGFVRVRAWSAWFERRWEREQLFALRQGFGMPKRRLQSLAPDARAACLARIRERLDRAPSDALPHRPEVVFATARRAG